MAIRHYKGPLGVFDYDDTEFKLERFIEWNEDYEQEDVFCLRYIGKETDGSKIKIPEGIKFCTRMFMNSPIETPPVIPDGVIDCDGMFDGCEALKEPPVIPDSVINCNEMFRWCSSLKRAPKIPASVRYCKGMFMGCTSLEEPPVIPNGIKDISRFLSGCKNLKYAPVIPDGVINCESSFQGCSSLKKAPKIPGSVKNCCCMFYKCEALTEPPIMSEGVEDCNAMFSDCISLVKSVKIPDSAIYCEHMFSGCKSLKYAPAMPRNVAYCRNMFKDCVALQRPPIIPANIEGFTPERLKSIENSLDDEAGYMSMFQGCSFESRLRRWGTHTFSNEELAILFQGKEVTLKGYKTRGGKVMDITGKFDSYVIKNGETRFGFVRTDLEKTKRKDFSDLAVESKKQAQDDMSVV